MLGRGVGRNDGATVVGVPVGVGEGRAVGASDVGWSDGAEEGVAVGTSVGVAVVGTLVGGGVVGVGVGLSVQVADPHAVPFQVQQSSPIQNDSPKLKWHDRQPTW